MRTIVLAVLLAACRQSSRHAAPEPPARTPPMRPTVLDAHAGATELFGGEPLIMSFTRDWERPGLLRLSGGRGPVTRTLQGWPIGVVGDRAYVIEPAGAQDRVLRVGLTGEPEQLATIPAAPAVYSNTGTVTGSGHVVLAISEGERATHVLVVAPDRSTRELSLVRDSDALVALVGDPASSTFAVVTRYSHGNASSQSAIAIVDAATGTTRASVTLPPLWATEGEAAFVDGTAPPLGGAAGPAQDPAGDGKLAVHLRDGVWSYDPATGARTKLLDVRNIDARAIAFAPHGDAIAWVHWVHPSDVMPLSMTVACEIYVARAAEPAPTEPAIDFPTGCYFGTGVLFVSGALWVAPRG